MRRTAFYSIFILSLITLHSYAQQPWQLYNNDKVLLSEEVQAIFNSASFKEKIKNDLCVKAGVPENEKELFLHFLNPYIEADEKQIRYQVVSGELGLTDVLTAIEAKEQKYIHKYSYFKLLKDSIIGHPQQAQMVFHGRAANGPCVNPDFEDGSTTGWSCSVGQNSGTALYDYSNSVPGCDPIRQIVQTAGFDPLIPTLSRVAPGRTYSLRLEDTDDGKFASRISQTFMVSAANSNFSYQYAVVLEDPSSGPHQPNERPYFSIRLKDENGNDIVCGNYEVFANNPYTGFAHYIANNCHSNLSFFNVSRSLYYKDWTTVIIPLGAYIGQNVTIEFTAADCSLGGHIGYAYIAASCIPLQIITSSPSICGGKAVTLKAPAGASSYSWTGPNGFTDTNRVVQVSDSGTYQVVLTSVSGVGCGATLSIHIDSSSSAAPVANFSNSAICAGHSIQFNDLSTPVGSIDSWRWDFDALSSDTSNLQNPAFTYSYNELGTRNVNLHVTWGQCGTDTTIAINVQALPIMTVSNDTGFCAGATAPHTFTVSGAGVGAQYDWSWFPNGVLNNSTNMPVVTPPDTTTLYIVKSTNSNGCTNYDTATYSVYPLPTAVFSVNSVCEGVANIFTDSSKANGGIIQSWNWTFNDPQNNTSTTQSPVFTYSQCGIYYASLIVSSDHQCQNVKFDSVTVNCYPQPSFIDTNVCQPVAAVFYNNTPNIATGGSLSFIWDFADGSPFQIASATAPVSHNFSACGTYNVKLSAISSMNCIADTVLPLTVYCNPTPVFTKQDVCYGNIIGFAGDSSSVSAPDSITAWQWDFGNNSGTASSAVTSYNYPAPGHYLVTLTVTTDKLCANATTIYTDVFPAPTANIDTNQVCEGYATTLKDASQIITPAGQTPASVIDQWFWDYTNDGTTDATTQNTFNTYPASGCYNVALKVITNQGCPDSIIKQACVNPNPVPLFSHTRNGCEPFTVTFRDSSTILATNPPDPTPSVIAYWIWDYGNGSETLTNRNIHTHTYAQADTFPVKLTVITDKGCRASSPPLHTIIVWAKPTAEFSATPQPTTVLNSDIFFNDMSRYADTIVWNFGDSDTLFRNLAENMHHYKKEGDYIVHQYAITKNGCSDTIGYHVIIEPEFTLYVPNAFSPNGDDKNDFFMFKGVGINKYVINIFDRWNNKVWKSEGDAQQLEVEKGWNGKANNSEDIAPVDQYIYQIIVTDTFNKQHDPKVGQFSLIR